MAFGNDPRSILFTIQVLKKNANLGIVPAPVDLYHWVITSSAPAAEVSDLSDRAGQQCRRE